MRNANIATALVLIAVGGVILVDAIRLGFGWGSDGPRSGFFPFWLAAILVAASAVNVARAVRAPAGEPFVTRQQFGQVLWVLVPASVTVALTPLAGLYVASALYMGFCMRWLGRHTWFASIGLPVFVSVANFFIFEKWFQLPLPKGPLEALLGY